MKIRSKLNIIVACLVILLFTQAGVQAASFTANLVQTERGATKTARFYFHSHQQYRMDVVEKGQELIVLVDRNKAKTCIRGLQRRPPHKGHGLQDLQHKRRWTKTPPDRKGRTR